MRRKIYLQAAFDKIDAKCGGPDAIGTSVRALLRPEATRGSVMLAFASKHWKAPEAQ